MSTLIIIGVAVAVAAAAACMMIVFSSENEEQYSVTYYRDGEKLLERTVPSGTSITILDEIGGGKDTGNFIGWNTRPDMSGSTLLPGMSMKVDRNISLYAMVAGTGMFKVMLPIEQKGFSITADPVMVAKGGSSILSYSLLPSHVDYDLVIAVNGNPMKLDAMKKIYLSNITEDQVVTVTGVYNRIEHSITLPEEQIGYILTASAEKVHQEQSYTLEYTLLPGYRETYEFGIHVNGGDARMPIDGILTIENVMGNHVITVTGVEAILYNVSAGKNVSAFVNGAESSAATVEDIITILPADGYVIPSTFESQIKGEFTVEDGRYRIASSISFPSILKVTAGENTYMDGIGAGPVFVCPEDGIKVSPSPGYSMPSNYVDKAKTLNGVGYRSDRFVFSDDVVLPSIYRVVFNSYNKVHATFYVVGGDECPTPTTTPSRPNYYFDKWPIDSKGVTEDLFIDAVWTPIEYNVTFGNNLVYSINGKNFSQPGTHVVTVEDLITISASYGYELPANYIPLGIFIKKGEGYNATSNYTFADICFVRYVDNVTNLSKQFFYTKSTIHTIVNPRTQPNPLFVFDLEGTGYELSDFLGWASDGQVYTYEEIIVDRNILFSSLWDD